MTSPAAQPKVRWDDSTIHNVHYPNFCQVTKSDRDVTVLFGTSEELRKDQEEVTVQLRGRVVLRPVAAKLLGTPINNTIAEFEAAHGELPSQFQALPGSKPLLGSNAPAALSLDGMPEKARLLIDLIRGLNVKHDVERSFKVLDQILLSHRFLIGIQKSALSPQAITRMPVILKRLGMPAPFLEALQRAAPAADFLHFGFEEGDHDSIYKVYLEVAGQFAETLENQMRIPEPSLLYVGYKWDLADPNKSAETRYVAHPRLASAEIDGRMAQILAGDGHEPTLALSRAITDLALSRVPATRLLYVAVTEEGNTRSSFDLNLYAAKLQISEIYPILVTLARRYSIPIAQFRDLYIEARHHTLGHISSGIDREGRDFLTIYFGGQSPKN